MKTSLLKFYGRLCFNEECVILLTLPVPPETPLAHVDHLKIVHINYSSNKDFICRCLDCTSNKLAYICR